MVLQKFFSFFFFYFYRVHDKNSQVAQIEPLKLTYVSSSYFFFFSRLSTVIIFHFCISEIFLIFFDQFPIFFYDFCKVSFQLALYFLERTFLLFLFHFVFLWPALEFFVCVGFFSFRRFLLILTQPNNLLESKPFTTNTINRYLDSIDVYVQAKLLLLSSIPPNAPCCFKIINEVLQYTSITVGQIRVGENSLSKYIFVYLVDSYSILVTSYFRLIVLVM